MDRTKRKLTFAELSAVKTKKLQSKLNDPDNLFQLIFALSQLKSCRFTYFSERDIALPIATRKQHSTIETLALYTVDTWNEILTLTSYTSNLRRLITPCGMDRDIDIETLLPLRLSNLTYLRTCFNYLNFHEFEIFIKKIYSPLKILHVEFLVEDVNFRDSDCWENLILTSLSHLEELYLIYKERFPPSDDLIFSGKLNPFSSPFWIDRRWFFEVETDINFVNYIVRPYRSCNNPTNLVRLLCFRIPAADDGTIEKLKRTIITNGITCDYTIKRIVDRVYIEWKLEPTIDSS
ncbi:unnamed protein product [Rotaria sp. Silwood1]|nr:unnamed protein product [Rotaria sp. Silwood1]